MLRRQRQIRTQVQRLVDAGLFAVSFYVAYWLRTVLPPRSELIASFFAQFGGTKEIDPFTQHYFTLFLLTVPISLVLLETQGFYQRPLIASRRQTFWQLVRVCSYSTIALILVTFLFREQPARSVVILFGGISFLSMLAKEELNRQWLETTFGQNHFRMRLILVGSEDDRLNLKRELRRTAQDGYDICAELDVNNTSVEELLHLLHTHSANGVILSATHTYFGRIEKVIQACELEGVQVWLFADFFKTQISQTTVDDFYGRPMLVFRSTPDVSWQSVGKRTLDVMGSFCLLILLGIPLLIVALGIRLTSPGPIFFRQLRSGLNGHPFTMYKFRSMQTNAEQTKHELAQFNEMEGPTFKISNDPRVTPIGRFLRHYSIDELPQLYNVLRGEMSLVGPRPLPVDETQRFNDLAHRRRLSVKPGLTCLWQISGRSNVTDFKEWVRLDLEYIDNWSLWLDLKILLGTIPVVLSGSGAK